MAKTTPVPNKENSPVDAELFRETYVKSVPLATLAKSPKISTPLVLGDPRPEPGGFPSLSKGTLNSHILQNSVTPDFRLDTLTKIYENKVMFIKFKYPRKLKSSAEPLNKPVAQLERTEDQIQDSIESSLRRTRREIADIVDSNPFDKFGTLTFDPKKHPNCADYDFAKAAFTQFMNYQKKQHGPFIHVATVERQSNGNIHFHVFLGGYTGQLQPTNVRGTGKNARQCYKISAWERKYGFADCEDISNKEAAGKYIGKYITKELFSNRDETTPVDTPQSGVLGKHSPIFKKGERRYLASQGLKKPSKKYNQTIFDTVVQQKLDLSTGQTYENDFAEITTFRKK